eukprot:6190940-Pleurochrysis_carterae.AAC.3
MANTIARKFVTQSKVHDLSVMTIYFLKLPAIFALGLTSMGRSVSRILPGPRRQHKLHVTRRWTISAADKHAQALELRLNEKASPHKLHTCQSRPSQQQQVAITEDALKDDM